MKVSAQSYSILKHNFYYYEKLLNYELNDLNSPTNIRKHIQILNIHALRTKSNILALNIVQIRNKFLSGSGSSGKSDFFMNRELP